MERFSGGFWLNVFLPELQNIFSYMKIDFMCTTTVFIMQRNSASGTKVIPEFILQIIILYEKYIP